MRRNASARALVRLARPALWKARPYGGESASLARSPYALFSQRNGYATAPGRRLEPAMVAFADGACRGNPGHGACGALIVDRATETIVASRAQYLGDSETNNTAEYRALLLALDLAEEIGAAEVEIRMDSELVVKQMRGQYRVKAPHLLKLFQTSHARCKAFKRVEFAHVPREQNALADRLANEALDQEAAASELDKQQTTEVKQ